MAFVPALGLGSRANSFQGACVSLKPAPRVASVRMAADKESEESPVFAKPGKSMWKESLFTGGFPGGEQFYKAWAEDGMTKDVPDMPESMQSRSEFVPKEEVKGGILGKLDNLEFFKGSFVKEDPVEAPPEEASGASAEPTISGTSESDAPDESLYAPYFPAHVRNLAPDIKLVYEKDFAKDRVYMSMTEVTASPTDVYFPKEMKGKAPIIEISYNGSSLAGASVSVRLDDITGPPTLPPPPKKGDAVTTLEPGRGGGLKLSYTVEGEGPVNI